MKRYSDFSDEISPSEIYEGLLGYGLFSEKLPPIFTSEEFYDYCLNQPSVFSDKPRPHVFYESMRNTNVPRQLGIPDPRAYQLLCKCISDNWDKIQTHFKQKTQTQKHTVSRIHIRKMDGTKALFKMNYENWRIDGTPEPDLLIGSKYIVHADISTCFPSIYTHSIPWALVGKDTASLICSAGKDSVKKKPFMIIEPAKKEYWELYKLGFDDLRIYSIGSSEPNSSRLCINPFERVLYKDNYGNKKSVSIQTHIDFVYAAFKASFIMYTLMPYVLEKAIYSIYEDYGWDIDNNINTTGNEIYPRLGDSLPEGYEIKDGDLYVGEDKSLFLKNKETFSEWANRLGIQFGRAKMPPDAYIDTKGVWHDDNDAWAEFEKKIMSGKFKDMPENPEEAAQEAYLEKYEKFMDGELKDDDCFVILDCHCFP